MADPFNAYMRGVMEQHEAGQVQQRDAGEGHHRGDDDRVPQCTGEVDQSQVVEERVDGERDRLPDLDLTDLPLWHLRHRHDPAHNWLRGELEDIVPAALMRARPAH